MLTISVDQMQQLETYAKASFEDRVLNHIRMNFREQTNSIGSDWSQRLFVRETIQSAWLDGFELEQDIVRYVGLVVFLGRDFDLKPRWHQLAGLLHASSDPASLRLDAAWKLATAAG
jgi:hypothetical protein